MSPISGNFEYNSLYTFIKYPQNFFFPWLIFKRINFVSLKYTNNYFIAYQLQNLLALFQSMQYCFNIHFYVINYFIETLI